MRDIYLIKRWKNKKEISPDNVTLFLNASATMVLNPLAIYSKQFLK